MARIWLLSCCCRDQLQAVNECSCTHTHDGYSEWVRWTDIWRWLRSDTLFPSLLHLLRSHSSRPNSPQLLHNAVHVCGGNVAATFWQPYVYDRIGQHFESVNDFPIRFAVTESIWRRTPPPSPHSHSSRFQPFTRANGNEVGAFRDSIFLCGGPSVCPFQRRSSCARWVLFGAVVDCRFCVQRTTDLATVSIHHTARVTGEKYGVD